MRVTVWVKTLCLSLALLGSLPATANQFEEDFGKYRIFHSVINSLMIPQPVANVHDLVRAGNKAYVNITLTEKGEDGSYSYGKPAVVTGTASNLLGQKQPLTFVQIRESRAAVYYLALLPFTNEEIFHFDITVTPENTNTPLSFKFTHKLYVENPIE